MRSKLRPGAARASAGAPLTEVLRSLENRGLEELRAEWRRLYRAEAPACFSRDLLLRSIAYRLQEAAFGGLTSATMRQLKKLATAPDGMRTTITPPPSLKPGVTLVREWHGQTHTVLVREEGFEHQGQCYASLSEIVRLITGARWSGPRFFGLRSTTSLSAKGRAGQPATCHYPDA